jgi:hypothetical protein
MKIFVATILTGFLLAMLSSCYYDKEELLYGQSNATCADTAATVSYAQKVVPLFQQYCYSCHSGNFPSGNISMGSYTLDKVIAQNGKLMGSINHASGFSPMPKGMSKLTACQIASVKKWIDTNMPNN